MYKNLSEYIAFLEREGELVRIGTRVDPVLEIAEITDRVSKSPGGGKALLFENTGTGFPVVTNLFGSGRRMATALGAESLDEISERLDGILREAFVPRGSLVEKMKTLPLLAELSKWFPRRIKGRGECQQVVLRGDKARLSALPILKCWPHDGGRFITLPLVHTVDPETGGRNVGMYRMQVFDDRATGMHWHVHKTGARHYEAYERAGLSRMPVSVCLGGDPAYTYAATAPMPDGIDEYLLAGFLRERPVRLVKCLTNDLLVPADCDFVIEGWVDTTEPLRTEGPFGDHTGFYSLEDPYPVFHVSAITHRRDAVWPATLVGIPPQEDAWLAAATEKIFLPPIRRAMLPEVHDLHMPPEGVAHNLAIVSMAPSYAGHPEKVANALWGAGQMMFNKVLIAAPAGFPIRNREAMTELLKGVDVSRDLVFGHGVADVLDHAMAVQGVGGKLLIDATHGRKGDRLPFVFEFDEAAEGLSACEKLWLGLADIDPARDITIKDGVAVVDCRAKIRSKNDFASKAHRCRADRSGEGEDSMVDTASTEKRGGATGVYFSRGMPSRWPNVVAMDEATVQLVDRRWAEYGIEAMGSATESAVGDPLSSPSDRYRKLLLPGGAEVKN